MNIAKGYSVFMDATSDARTAYYSEAPQFNLDLQ